MSPSIFQIVIVLVIVLVFFGPKRIPGLGKSLGEAIRGFKKGITEDAIDVTESSKEAEKIAEDKTKEEVKTSAEKEKVKS